MHRDSAATTLPSPFQEQLLRVLLAPAPVAREAWHQLEPSFDLDRLEPSVFHVLPMLHARMQELSLSSDIQPRLGGLRRHTWYRAERAARRTCELLCRLEEHGVQPLLIDGPALAARLYPEVGLRTPGEPVVLLRRHEQARAMQALVLAGWQPQHRTARLRALVRSQRLADQDGFTVQIGTGQSGLLHGPLESAALWDRAEPVQLYDTEHLVPSLPHLLLLLLQPHHRAAEDRRCVWPVDASRALAHPSFDAPEFGRLCEQVHPVWVAEPLAYLEAQLGTALPVGLRKVPAQGRLLGTAGERAR